MLKELTLVVLFSLMCSNAFAAEAHSRYATDPLEKDTFSFKAPSKNDLAGKISLWATYYYLPQFNDDSGEFPLRDMNNAELGPKLSLHDWCHSALEGSVRIMSKTGEAKTFNYAGTTSENPVDCSSVFSFNLSKTKFREALGPYGDGIKNYILAPYRTIATDTNKIAPGTVLYIPAARGAKITLASGRVIIHDGYFFAGDKGGAIKDNHIDVFIGTHSDAPFFPWIRSHKNFPFEAFVVTDKKIISDLYELHAL